MSYVGYNLSSSIGYDISLEDEILFLRNEMMRTFQEEQSFTSDLVIQISCKQGCFRTTVQLPERG